jgi:hypothetical protein
MKFKTFIIESYYSNEMVDFYSNILIKAGIGKNIARREVKILFDSPDWKKIDDKYTPLLYKNGREFLEKFPQNSFIKDKEKNPEYIKLKKEFKKLNDERTLEREKLIKQLIIKLKNK